jgi:hypothetical protein
MITHNCFICHKRISNSSWSVCYDPEYKHNVWGGDSHQYVSYIHDKCVKKILKEAEQHDI